VLTYLGNCQEFATIEFPAFTSSQDCALSLEAADRECLVESLSC
jgi:hypothetical protein